MIAVLEARRRRAARIAEEAGLAALAFVPGSNFSYLTGLEFHLMERPTLLFITSDGAILGIIPDLERNKWLTGFPDAQSFFWRDSDGFEAAFRACATALGSGPIGVEGQRMRMFEFEALAHPLPAGAVRNAEAALSELRICKDAAEIDAMRQAIRVSETALAELLDGARAGDTEQELTARLKQAMLSHGAEGFSFDPLILSGPKAADPHGEPDARPVKPGEVLLIDFGARVGGMNADITRTFFCEHVPEARLAVYEAVRAANAQGRDIAGPGVTAERLDRETTNVLASSPFADMIVHKTGHGLGLDVHEAPQIMIGNPTPLRPGMVVTIEPGLYRPGDLGVRIEDDVLITETGAESLSSFPREARSFG